MQRWFSIGSGVLAGVVITFAYAKLTGNSVHERNPYDKDRISLMEKQISELQQKSFGAEAKNGKTDTGELLELKKQMADLLNSIESSGGDADVVSSSDDEDSILTYSGDLEAIKEQARQREIVLRNTLEDNFSNDDVEDAEWAQGTQDKIESAFQSEKLLGSSLVSSTCKSNICKLEISPDLSTVDGDMAMYQNELLVALSGRLKSSALRVDKNTDGSPRIIGYFGRQGSAITKDINKDTSVVR